MVALAGSLSLTTAGVFAPAASGSQAVAQPIRVEASQQVPVTVVADVQRTARVAWARVLSVWGSAAVRPQLRLVVGNAALAVAAGRATAAARGLVAVTTGDEVLVDATAYVALAPSGREVLLAHELTHLATGAAGDPDVPVWLEEGFADYVGFLRSSLAVGPVAEAAIERARVDGPPTAVPADSAFGSSEREQAVAYAQSWLMCRWLALTYGQDALVDLYRRVAHGRTSLAVAVEQATGSSLSDAIDGWGRSVAGLRR